MAAKKVTKVVGDYEVERMIPVKVVYANGERPDEYDTYEEAVAAMEERYPDGLIGHDGDLSDGGDRTLIWASEGDAADDAGQKAVAQIVEIDG